MGDFSLTTFRLPSFAAGVGTVGSLVCCWHRGAHTLRSHECDLGWPQRQHQLGARGAPLPQAWAQSGGFSMPLRRVPTLFAEYGRCWCLGVLGRPGTAVSVGPGGFPTFPPPPLSPGVQGCESLPPLICLFLPLSWRLAPGPGAAMLVSRAWAGPGLGFPGSGSSFPVSLGQARWADCGLHSGVTPGVHPPAKQAPSLLPSRPAPQYSLPPAPCCVPPQCHLPWEGAGSHPAGLRGAE